MGQAMSARRRGSLLAHPSFKVAIAILSLWCAAPGSCGGGGGGSSGGNNGFNLATPSPPPTSPNLTESDVNTVVLQAMNEARARGKPATIAVVDRVGNVLTVAQMTGAPTTFTIDSFRNIGTGLENRTFIPANFLPTTLAAIAKALTGAYLSSNGNAFTTRTASQIIQEHFNPGVAQSPAGPLFGVQFSQLSCSDFNTVASAVAGGTNGGPHRSPLGFSADSGGMPLYKNGILAGGIGIMTKSIYSLDANVFNVDIDDDEVVAIAGQSGFEPPDQILASNIALGISLRYADANRSNLAAPVSATGSFTPVAPIAGYFAGPAAGKTSIAGLAYGSSDGASGIVQDGTFGPVLYPGTISPAFVFTDGTGNVLYKPTAGLAPAGGAAITAGEAQAMMISALNVAFVSRAAIRSPTNSHAQVTIGIVDLDGNVVSMARTPDAPVFGADVSLQKARSALFFTRTDAAAKINAITATSPSTTNGTFADYITRSRQLIGPTAFSDGIAWSEVSIGDVSRPYYPDGIDSSAPGSLSLPFNRWSPFSDGIQLDLAFADIVNGILGIVSGGRPPQGCANIGLIGGVPTANTVLPVVSGGKTQLANGLQIFSGGFPIYRGNTLVGGIGISGDGIQQDTMVSFLGVQNGPATLNHAPAGIRADVLSPGGTRLRYANCPQNPFLDSRAQNPC